MDWSRLLDAIKLAPRYLLAVALATGALLLGPAALTDAIGLSGIVAKFRAWFGAALLFSVALLAAHALAPVGSWIRAQFDWWVQLRAGRRRLRQLTPDEKQILSRYILEDTRTQSLSIMDGTVKELEAMGIIRRASSLGHGPWGFAYNIQPWAWTELRKHPDLVDLKKEDVRGGGE